ncbi:hypothetical protein HHK36_002757 [Tetracentron sinense]|uniref:ZCF37 n=1 Tax=Tetracentron sinense TaxID=13715 RepID=A0A834ZM23_TETSI|nr:hypothetical protein HHK36_002757 [Tetracentron sinense]
MASRRIKLNYKEDPILCLGIKPICVRRSFHQEEEEDGPWNLSSTPRRSRRSSTCRSSNRDSKNPYSNRGLDKFSTVLADLEERRQQIYAQRGSQDISFVRFVHSNSDDWVPIVVKLRDQKQGRTQFVGSKDKPVTHNSEALDKSPMIIESSAGQKEVQQPGSVSDGRTKKKSFSWSKNLDQWRRPSYYLPIIIVLILLCLVMFGRSVAILCTSLGWYLVPAMKGGDSNFRRSMKKKDSVKKSSEKKIGTDRSSSPTSKKVGAMKELSPRKHGHGESW